MAALYSAQAVLISLAFAVLPSFLLALAVAGTTGDGGQLPILDVWEHA